MAHINQQDRKVILSDPSAYLEQNRPYLSAEKISQLETIIVDYQQQKFRHTEARENKNITSREIGEAKRNNLDIDILLSRMRELSQAEKNLKGEIRQIEQTLLDNFTFASTESANSNKQDDDRPEIVSLINQSRIYISGEQDTSTVHISPLNTESLSDEQLACIHYIKQHTNASIYHHPRWMQVIKKSFGHPCFYLVAKQGTGDTVKIVGILPIVRLSSKLFGDFFVSMPYFNYGGVLGDSPAIEEKLIQHANSMARQVGSNHIEYRDDIPRDMPCRNEKHCMLLPLPDSAETLLAGFSSKLRSQIKKTGSVKHEVKINHDHALEDFYSVFARNMRDLGTPVYPKSFFSNIIEAFPDNTHIITVHIDNKPVSAAFLIGYKEMMEIPWASTIRSVNHLGMNMNLYWAVLQHAIRSGYRIFDFGRSSADSNTWRFKKQWGAMPRQSYWHYWLNDNVEMPQLNPSNPKYALMIGTWKRLPVWLTKIIGPPVVKYLP